MKNYKIIASFVSLEGPKVRVNETGFNFMIFNLIFVQIACNTMLYKILEYVLEPVLIQRIFLSLEAILEKNITLSAPTPRAEYLLLFLLDSPPEYWRKNT